MKQLHQHEAIIAHNEAIADLLDILSVTLAYPGNEIIDLLGNGSIVEAVKRSTEALINPGQLLTAAQSFGLAIDSIRPPFTPEKLESDYIALFELNKEQPPLHLNAHLYSDGNPDPARVYQRLIDEYQSVGIEPKTDAGVEQPDHLSVQLEFQAYLYRLLNQSLRGEIEQAADVSKTVIDDFAKELEWVHAWLQALEQRGGHPLYAPLGRLLWAVLENTRPATG